MASKFIVRGLFALVLLFVFTNVYNQKIDNYYTSHSQSKGRLYYIFPQEIFKWTDGKGKLTYDFTINNNTDSVTLTFSYVTPNQISPIEGICFAPTDSVHCFSTQKVLIEPFKKSWKYRYTTNINFNTLRQLFEHDSPPNILLQTGLDETLRLKASRRKWKKYAAINNKVFYLIEVNK